jgi:hypothetical protein
VAGPEALIGLLEFVHLAGLSRFPESQQELEQHATVEREDSRPGLQDSARPVRQPGYVGHVPCAAVRVFRHAIRTLAVAAVVTSRPAVLAAQDSATVVLGQRYARSRGVFDLGGHGWRAAWGAEVRLPLITPATIRGGLREAAIEPGPLTGVVVGWGMADGLAWRVLPVDPDPITPILSAEAKQGGLPSFLRDLVSTLHPAAPTMAASLYRAAELPVVERRLGVVPADGVTLPSQVAPPGAAVWVERAPELDGRSYGPFASVIGTDSLLARLHEVAGTRVDLHTYLAVRLTDVLLGDRNRAGYAWLWGWDTARSLWVPVARAQEQALLQAGRASRLLLGAYQPGVVSFGPHEPHTLALTLRAWDLDRPWLALLDRATWDSVAGALAARLDDAAIEHAVSELPDAYRRLAGEEIARALRVRRDALPAVVAEYYRLMTRYPDLELTDLVDSVSVVRSPDGALEIAVQREGRREPLRRFTRDETEEVRLHLGAGADHLVLKGVDRPGVGLRVTGGPGLDGVVREDASASRVVLYDERDGITRTPDDAARLVPHAAQRQQRWVGTATPPPADHGTRRSPGAVLGYNSDLGLYAGAGMRWKWHGFDEPHYRQRLAFSFAYALKAASARGTASFERRDVLHNVHVSAEALASGIEVVRYHGLGNETVDTAAGEFYRALHRQYTARAMVGISRDPAFEFQAGPVLMLQSTDTTGTASLVAIENPYGAGDFDVAGIEASLRYQPERSSFAPGAGVVFWLKGQYYPALLDAESAFGGLSGEVDATWVPRLAGRLIVAGRLGGSVLRGQVPFARAARVGGPRTLRGVAVDRFAGDRGSAYGSLELRSRLTRFRLGIAPGDLGILVFGSGGRVWQSGESSGTMHWAGGGGLWIAPTINWLPGLGDIVGRVEVAHSGEGTFFYFGTGFRF